MTQLDQLPNELLLLSAQYLHNQRDINAFVQTNKTLYHVLHAFLCRFNVKYHQSSALLWAARNGHIGLVTRLLDAGANISAYESPTEVTYDPENLVDLFTINPLLAAAQGGYIGALKAMLSEKRPDRACSPAQLRTVLHWAIRSHDSNLVELMIENNAPLNPAGDHQKSLSALGVAVASGNNSVIPRFLELGARSGDHERPCPVEQAICTDQPQLVELLLRHGIQPNGDEGLCHIVRRNDKSLLKLLLRYGLKLEFYVAPLFIAIMEDQYEMVEMLIDNGANPRLENQLFTRDEDDVIIMCFLSPIGFAIYFRRLNILKLLLEKGVLPVQDDLELAVDKKYEEAVVLLSKFSNQDLPNIQSVSSYIMWTGYLNRMENPDFWMPYTSWVFDESRAGDR
ncbi:ankyrin repeat-containing domain protein [Aspergillus leporis]|jgi:ankyrin repeat protein|uniref:Ankyrin repeat-containing domain protein n=1 Tax=Aspergillus leporis TaxID=41062 RepID=A0A5N5WH31_9EURO|nr:ankyrin repeat-containing domain protein [Aspergillus leporis]